jgi:hypothetical protein
MVLLGMGLLGRGQKRVGLNGIHLLLSAYKYGRFLRM